MGSIRDVEEKAGHDALESTATLVRVRARAAAEHAHRYSVSRMRVMAKCVAFRQFDVAGYRVAYLHGFGRPGVMGAE
jgi:hypothetical protein